MNYDKQAYILEAVDALQAQGSRTGKTHVQKTLARAGYLSAMPFRSILYKHGPYSFDVDDEIAQMESYDAIRVIPQELGFRIEPSAGRRFIRDRSHPDQMILDAIDHAAEFARDKNVAELEADATAAWIIARESIADLHAVSRRLRDLKPHIDQERADRAAKNASEFFASYPSA